MHDLLGNKNHSLPSQNCVFPAEFSFVVGTMFERLKFKVSKQFLAYSELNNS